MQQNAVAIAYFDVLEISREIKFSDSLDDPNLLFLHALKTSLHAVSADSEEEISGCLIVFPSNSPPALHAAAAASIPGDDRPFATATARAAEFSIEAGQRALRSVRGKISGKFEALAMRAVGGLCKYLERVAGSRYSPVGISRFAVDGFMAVDPETIAALQIFPTNRVKSIVHGAGRSHGETSIFSTIGNFTSSIPGRQKLSQWLALPLRSKAALESRLDAVEAFTAASTFSMRNFQHNLGSVKDLVKQLKRVATKHDFEGKSKVVAWKSLIVSLKAVLNFAVSLEGSPLDAVKQLTNRENLLRQLVTLISETIDFEASARDAQIRVHAGLVPGIDALRGKQREIEILLSRLLPGQVKFVAEKLKTRAARFLQTEVVSAPGNSTPGNSSDEDDPLQLKLQYYPRLGYLVSVDLEISSRYPNMAEMLDWTFQFKSEDAVFFKSSICKEMDVEFGDIVGEIRKAEYQVLYDLCSKIASDGNLADLHAVTDAAAELDCLIALALTAKCLGWTRPQLVDAGNTKLINARHPLIEGCAVSGKSIVPNSFEINERNFHVISGPNASGKSTFLKQTGSIIYLAQIGSFVPAQATISIVDFLSCRFSSDAEEDVSAFNADLLHLSKTLQNAKGRSLIIIDEFGRGTCHPDAVALTAGFAEYSVSLELPPTVVISTHFGSEIFRDSASHVKTFTTSLIPPVDSKSEPTFLYQLKPGISNCAFALNCARRANLPGEVVRRAEEILGALRAGDDPPAKREETERSMDLEIVNCFKNWNKGSAADFMKKLSSMTSLRKFALLPF